MIPYPIQSVPPSQSARGDDSSSADEARREDRRARAGGSEKFKATLRRAGGGHVPQGAGQAAGRGEPKPLSGGISNRPVLPAYAGPCRPPVAVSGKVAQAGNKAGQAGSGAEAGKTVSGKFPRKAGEEVLGPDLGRELGGGLLKAGGQGAAEVSSPADPRTMVESAALNDETRLRCHAPSRQDRGDQKDGEDDKPEGAGALSSDSPSSGQPVPTAAVAMPQANTPTAGLSPAGIPTTLLQQVVEFATVAPNADGFMEFRLGLARHALGGLRIRVSAYGNRRVGLNIRGAGGGSGIGDEDVAGLIRALRERNVEVVEVALE